MKNLPEDVFGEILSRLPVKSLLCLRRVCKSWRSYISNPHFAKLQLVRNMNNPNRNDYFIAHYYHGSHKLYVIKKTALHSPIDLKLPLPTSNSRTGLNVVGSCNGLLCLAYQGSLKRREQDRLYLWNPATGQLKDIDFNNSIRQVCLGFVFDNASSDYMVVSFVRNGEYFVKRVEVYSLNQNSWKAIDDVINLRFRIPVLSSPPAIVKGLFYLLTIENYKPLRLRLVSFNVQSGKFCTISTLPAGINCPDIFEFNDSVAISTGQYSSGKGINIWKLNDDSCWIKMHTIKNERIRNFFGCLNTGEFVGQSIHNELALCHPVNKVIKYITQVPTGTRGAYNFSVSLENLACVWQI